MEAKSIKGYEYIYWLYHRINGKISTMDPDYFYCVLFQSINQSTPLIYGKIGGFELYALRVSEFQYKNKYEDAYNNLCICAGFFSDNKDIEECLYDFSNCLKKALAKADYLIRWLWPKDAYFMKKYGKNTAAVCDFGTLSNNYPIGGLIEEKKVLVVSPFSKSIECQYSKRGKLFSNPRILPDFDLITFQSVLSVGRGGDSRFRDWFEALEYMRQEISKLDFDVALVGCGAYSLPLCAYIKDLGKPALHLGGALQLMFGIMGGRWEHDEYVLSLVNEHWKRPYDFEIPKDADLVENSSYW